MQQRDAVGRVARQRQRVVDRTVRAHAEIDGDRQMVERFDRERTTTVRDRQDRHC